MKKRFRYKIYLVTLIILFNQNCFSLQTKNCNSESVQKLPIKNKGKVLLVVAHQDDEVFFASLLRQHIKGGSDIQVVWTANSQFKGQAYQNRRINESKKAMEFLGIPLQNLHFLNYPDAETYEHSYKIFLELKILLKKIRPEVIYIPAYEGGNIDHDIAHFCTVMAVKALRISPIIFEVPMYNAYKASVLPFRIRSIYPGLNTKCRLLSKSELQNVLKMWSIYKSQHSIFGLFLKLSIGKKKCFGTEFIRVLPEYDYLKPPINGKIAYKKYLKANFKDFINAIQGILEEVN